MVEPLDHNTGYKQWSVNLASYIGQKITARFTADEVPYQGEQTSFVFDDTALNDS